MSELRVGGLALTIGGNPRDVGEEVAILVNHGVYACGQVLIDPTGWKWGITEADNYYYVEFNNGDVGVYGRKYLMPLNDPGESQQLEAVKGRKVTA